MKKYEKNHKNTSYIPKWEKGQKERPCLKCGPKNTCLNNGPCEEYSKWNSWDLKKKKIEDSDVPDGVYDNDLTDQRERWENNQVVSSMSKKEVMKDDSPVKFRWGELPSVMDVVWKVKS